MENKIQNILKSNLSKLPLNYQYIEVINTKENQSKTLTKVTRSEIHQTNKFTLEAFYKRLNINLPINYLDKTKVINEE